MGFFNRPTITVLSSTAVIPSENLIQPVPNLFTHELTKLQPYWYSLPKKNEPPSGQFEPGTQLVLMSKAKNSKCFVVDARGLYVVIDGQHLKRMIAEKAPSRAV
jgi:hypothetical protein